MSKKREEDISDFVRYVEHRSEMLNPQQMSYDSIPVLTMPKSVRIWRMVRLPLFFTGVLTILLTVGLITRGFFISKSIEETIAEAQAAEVQGTVDQIQVAGKTLFELSEKYGSRANVQEAWAWQAVLQVLLWGPDGEIPANAVEALAAVADSDSALAMAATAGEKYIAGEPNEALSLAVKGLEMHSDSYRLSLIRVLALDALGDEQGAMDELTVAMTKNAEYVPLLVIGLSMSMKRNRQMESLSLAKALLQHSPTNLFGALVMIKLSLPFWDRGTISGDQVDQHLRQLSSLKNRIELAPDNLRIQGHYLQGRVHLLAGNLDNAIRYFKKTMREDPGPEVLGWYAKAVHQKLGPQAALAVIDKYPKDAGPEALDVSVQCLLEHYRVDDAKVALDKLSASRQLNERTKQLRWQWAIGSGDLQTAKAMIPKRISLSQQWLALELYFQLKDVGDKEGIVRLADAMKDAVPMCSEAITVWHGNRTQRALWLLNDGRDGKDACIDGLAVRLMRRHTDAAGLKDAAENVRKASGNRVAFEVDRALATWSVDGYDAARSILDSVKVLQPQGLPLRRDLANAYLEMGLPQEALEVAGGSEDPELFSVRVRAYRDAGKKTKVNELTKIARDQLASSPDAAVAYIALKSLFNDEKVAEIRAWYEQNLAVVNGKWAPDVLAVVANAMSFMGDRAEADKLLLQNGKSVVSSVGLDVSWRIRIYRAKINVGRGGKNMYRALSIVTELNTEKVKDPWLYYHHAIVNLVEGNERAAIRLLTDALGLDPTFKTAYKKLAELGRLGDVQTQRMNLYRPRYRPI